jgi:hypothetical protein
MGSFASPEWQRLADALGDLSRESGATNGYVLDAWANLWCAGNDLYLGGESGPIMELTQAQLLSLPRPLNRGGRIDRAQGLTYFRSFAGIYVVVLRFQAPFDLAALRPVVTKALPRIEALTLALPPPEGPGSGGAEGVGVA